VPTYHKSKKQKFLDSYCFLNGSNGKIYLAMAQIKLNLPQKSVAMTGKKCQKKKEKNLLI
jgi:hypothetical protein